MAGNRVDHDDPRHLVASEPPQERDVDGVDVQLWPMGAVTRRTGIGEHTLRAWERRFGFPVPRRLPSGHRRYTAEQVERLLMVNAALALGHRAGEVVPLSREQLEQLLSRHAETPRAVPIADGDRWLAEVLEAVHRLDAGAVSNRLRREAATLGVPRFLEERIVPLLVEVGEAWVRGELGVRHEHLLSGCVEDQLRSLRMPLEGHAVGSPVVLATLPGEQHGLGLQLVATLAAALGRRVRILGMDTPLEEIATAARTLEAAAVGVSVSSSAAEEETGRQLVELRRHLPSSVRLWVGGAGGGRLRDLAPGTEILPELAGLKAAILDLAG